MIMAMVASNPNAASGHLSWPEAAVIIVLLGFLAFVFWLVFK